MTGTGEVTKRRVREGRGEFPVDCPLEDCAVRVHFRVWRPGSQQVAQKASAPAVTMGGRMSSGS